jgi:hypothetical protein
VSAVLYNHNDQDFSENIIDKKSLEFFESKINKVENLLSRTVLWYNFHSMTERAAYPIFRLTEMIDTHLFEEKVDFLFENMLTRLRLSIAENLPRDQRERLSSLIFKHIYAELTSKKELSKERANILQNELINFARSEDEISILHDWLEGRDAKLAVYKLDISRKWSIARNIFTLKKLSLEQKKVVFDDIAKTDDSDKKVE